MPTGLIAADFFMPASAPSAGLCLEDTVATRRAKGKRGGPKEGRIAVSPLHSRNVPNAKRGEQNQKWIVSPPRAGGRIRGGPQVGKVGTYPCRLGGPHRLRAGGAASEVAHKWAT